jgi:hypothetical protein
MRSVLLLVAAAALLGACGEAPQLAGTPKADQSPSVGTGVQAFASTGWKAGDKVGWEQALKARMQLGQNEYSRAAALPTAAN